MKKLSGNGMKLCDTNCLGCHYAKLSYDGESPICLYILFTGKRRPCPMGEGCTVRKEQLSIGAVWEGAYPEYDHAKIAEKCKRNKKG